MDKKEIFSDIARGAALGTGILPGVSVGTVGLIVNVYDKLIGAIAGLTKKKTFAKSFLTLLPIALSCLVFAFLLLLFWNKLAYPRFPFVIIAALAGFVIGALPLLIQELRGQRFSLVDGIRVTIGFLLAATIGVLAFLGAAGVINLNLDFQGPVDDPFHNPWIFLVILVVGIFAACSCIIPGISGSMILFIFGLYNPIVNIFLSTRDAEGNVIHASIFHDASKLGGGLTAIIVLLVGMLVGFILTSKLMKSLLEKHKRETYTVIIGFVLGSLVSMFMNNDMYHVYTTAPLNAWYQILIGALVFLLVAIATYFLIRRRGEKSQRN